MGEEKLGYKRGIARMIVSWFVHPHFMCKTFGGVLYPRRNDCNITRGLGFGDEKLAFKLVFYNNLSIFMASGPNCKNLW